MSLDIQNLALGGNKDPFASAADAELQSAEADTAASSYIHIRNQQRKGRKSLTTVQGLDTKKYDAKRILAHFKKTFSCNGTVVITEDLGPVLQLSGDQRTNVADFLVNEGLVSREQVKIHGA
eukprot:GHVN01045868.1.p1 GENE.GHVN01045868.1~~GHVN01045868.1.p1  ORF type:complete len:122 (+),score=6.83 GHVN01045868.1:137-502(+)